MDNAGIAALLHESRSRPDDMFLGDGLASDEIARFWTDISLEDLRGCFDLLHAQKGTTVNGVMAGTRWDMGDGWIGGRVWWQWVDPLKQDRFRLYQQLYRGTLTLAAVETEHTCKYNVEMAYYFGAAAIPALPAAVSANGITYTRGPVNVHPERGTYTTWIEKRTRLYQTVAEFVSEESAADQTKRTRYLGVKDGDKNDSGTAIVLPMPGLGKIVGIDRQRNEDCTQDVTADVQTPKNQTATDGEARADQTSETQKATQADAQAQATPMAGAIVRATNVPTRFGKLATSKETITPINQTATDQEERHDQATETLKATQADTEVTATQVAGKIVRATNAPTPFGKVQTALETVEARNQTATDREARADQTSETLKATQADTEVTGVPVAGKIVRATNVPTPFGKVKTELETITPINQAATDGEARADQTSETDKATQTDAPAVATPVTGKIVRATNTPTPFGKLATSKETITPINQTTTDREERHDQATETLKATQADTEVTATQVAGKIVRATNAPTPFGKVQTALETITGKPQSLQVTLASQDGSISYLRRKNVEADDLAADVAACTTATRNDFSGDVNEFSLLSYQITKISRSTFSTDHYPDEQVLGPYEYRMEGAWYKIYIYIRYRTVHLLAQRDANAEAASGYRVVAGAASWQTGVVEYKNGWKSTRVEMSKTAI